MKASYNVNLFINIPPLCQSIEYRATSNETLDDVKRHIFESLRLEKADDWNFYMLGKDYVQLDGQMKCYSVSFLHAEQLFLYNYSSVPLTVYYLNKKASVAIKEGAPLSSICQTLISLFHLEDIKSFFFLNPITYNIMPIDVTPRCSTVIFKSFEINEDNLILFKLDSSIQSTKSTSVPIISKLIFTSQFKSFLTSLKTESGKIEFCKLCNDTMQGFYDELNDIGPDINATPEERISFLFSFLLTFKYPLVPKELQGLAKRVGCLTDQRDVLKQTYLIVEALPMDSHCILLELCQSIGMDRFDEETNNILVNILYRILFLEKKPKKPTDLTFVRIIVKFGYSLLLAPAQNKPFYVNGRVAYTKHVNDNEELFSLNGIEDFKKAEPYDFSLKEEDLTILTEKIEENGCIDDALESTNYEMQHLLDAVQESKRLIEKVSKK